MSPIAKLIQLFHVLWQTTNRSQWVNEHQKKAESPETHTDELGRRPLIQISGNNPPIRCWFRQCGRSSELINNRKCCRLRRVININTCWHWQHTANTSKHFGGLLFPRDIFNFIPSSARCLLIYCVWNSKINMWILYYISTIFFNGGTVGGGGWGAQREQLKWTALL